MQSKVDGTTEEGVVLVLSVLGFFRFVLCLPLLRVSLFFFPLFTLSPYYLLRLVSFLLR